MILRSATAIVLSIATFTVGCASGGERDITLSAADVDAIRQITDQEIPRLIVAHDWDALATVFTDDAVLMPFGEPELRGRADVVDEIKRNWGLLTVRELTQSATQIDGSGDLAYARGAYSVTVEVREPTVIYDRGKFLLIFRRQADNSWRIVTTSYSRDIPKPEVSGT
jgi:ketosteroid isomerase-like protein